MKDNNITVIPAIDIIDGKAVRLTQGDYSRRTTYSDRPDDLALQFADNGARWLHLVDLEGAKSSRQENFAVLERIVTLTGLSVEWGGGLRTSGALRSVFDAGAAVAICGSAAVKTPDLFSSWLECYGPDRIALSVDLRDGKVAVDGWVQKSDYDAGTLLGQFIPYGLERVICTDISKDGMLSGPSWSVYQELKKNFPNLSITVSGGVASVRDIELADSLGLDRIIIGKALYEGLVTMEELKKWWQKE